MRKLLLGVLAYTLASSAVVRAQDGPAYQEPLSVVAAASQLPPARPPIRAPFEQFSSDFITQLPQGAPPEPNEPYLVQVGNWKPRKGYTFYGSAEYLFWWLKGQTLPDGLSLSVADPNAAADLTTRGTSGGRFFFGMWLDERQSKALEAGYLFVGRRNSTSAQTFPGSAVANQPFFAGISSETASLDTSSGIWGAEANGRWQAWRTPGANDASVTGPTASLDLLIGFRYLDLSEGLTINNATRFTPGAVLLSDAALTTSDTFGTHNHIFAGQIGADAGVRWGRLGMNLYSKVAFGSNQQTVNISGITHVNAPAGPGVLTLPGGFYTQPSNIGHFTRDGFTVIPEAGLSIGYVLADRCRLTIGYSFLYLTGVVRPGGQVDATAGGASRPPIGFLTGVQSQPAFNGFNLSGFWAQGITAGLELSY